MKDEKIENQAQFNNAIKKLKGNQSQDPSDNDMVIQVHTSQGNNAN